MSKITTYKEGQFSQINLDDGNKILVSIGFSDIKIFKLNWLGLSKETIWSSSGERSEEIIYRDKALSVLVENIKECSFLDQVRAFCETIKEERLLDYGLL